MSDTARWTIEIVCTDRGQHKRTWMTRFIWDSDWRYVFPGGWHDAPKHDMFGPPEANTEHESVISRESYGFTCSRCKRWPKISDARWIEIMDAARHAGVGEFDVSFLD